MAAMSVTITPTFTDIFDPIYATMSYMGRCALRQCCRRFAGTAAPRFADELAVRLSPGVSNLITRTGGVLAGGFVLACLNDHGYGDIDIVFDKNNRDGQILMGNLVSGNWVGGDCDTSRSGDAYASNKFEYDGYEINRIIVDRLLHYINSFDLDICKVWYDGRVHISAPESVVTMTCNSTQFVGSIYYALYSTGRGITRADKYTARGYDMSKHDATAAYKSYDAVTDLVNTYLIIPPPAAEILAALKHMQKYCSHCVCDNWAACVNTEIRQYFGQDSLIDFPAGPGCAWCGPF